jgi:hypothetical protein
MGDRGFGLFIYIFYSTTRLVVTRPKRSLGADVELTILFIFLQKNS